MWDVLVVQTSALDEDRMFGEQTFSAQPAEVTGEGTGPATGANPAG